MRRAAKLSTEYPATLASLLCALLSKFPRALMSQGRARVYGLRKFRKKGLPL